MRHTTKLLARLAFLALPVSALSTACVGEETSQEQAAVGTLSAALETVGSDGATYGFPEEMRLAIRGTSYSNYLDLSGSGAVASTRVPVGAYSAGLEVSWVPVAAGGKVQLTRTENGETKTVEAVWTNAAPLGVTIVADQTTSLVLTFKVEGIGDVTFSLGSLEVTATVDRDESPVLDRALVDATYTVTSITFGGATSQAARDALSMQAGETSSLDIEVRLTSQFAPRGVSIACADVEIVSMTASAQALAYAVEPLDVATTGPLCVYDFGTEDRVSIGVSRGARPAPESQVGFLPGNYAHNHVLDSWVAADVYDGATVRQSLFESPVVFSHASYEYRAWEDFSAPTYYGIGSVAGTIRFVR